MKANLYIFITIFIIISFFSCNLFEPGTGDKVDVEPPTITLDSHDGGETCRGTITIDGAYDDDLEVDTIQISFDNGTTYQNTTFEDGTWSYTVNTTNYKDSKYNIIVKITDKSEKSSNYPFLLYFDNHAPLVLVEFP